MQLVAALLLMLISLAATAFGALSYFVASSCDTECSGPSAGAGTAILVLGLIGFAGSVIWATRGLRRR